MSFILMTSKQKRDDTPFDLIEYQIAPEFFSFFNEMSNFQTNIKIVTALRA